MPDYKAMYFELFRASVQAVELLQAAQAHAEQQFLEAAPPPLRLDKRELTLSDSPEPSSKGTPSVSSLRSSPAPSRGSLIEKENFSADTEASLLREVARRKP